MYKMSVFFPPRLSNPSILWVLVQYKYIISIQMLASNFNLVSAQGNEYKYDFMTKNS